MDTRNNDFDFDFTPIGQAIKKARTAKGMTREQLARIVDYDPRHLQAIENEGQKPSLELLIQLVTMFGVSVDEYIFPDNCKTTNSNTYLTTLNTHIIFKYLVKLSKNLHNKKQITIRRLHHQPSVIESALGTKK